MSDSPASISIVAKTRAWWEALVKDEAKLNTWLQRLAWNEHMAVCRFEDFAEKFCDDGSEEWHLFHFIAMQERRHAHMVEEVVAERGLEPRVDWPTAERYWDKVMPCAVDMATAAGVGALAEGLSLERLRVMANHPYTVKRLADLFRAIERDETLHAMALANLAGKHGIASVIDCHSDGLVALGLKLQSDVDAAKALLLRPRLYY